MRNRALVPFLVLLLGLVAGPAAPGPARAERLAFVDISVLDGTGAPPALHRTVLVADGRIVAVTGLERPPPGYRRIDGRGRTILPGLWDMHVHSLWSSEVPGAFFPRFVAYGVTTVRDMGGNEAGFEAALAVTAAHPAWSPRVYRAGRILDGPEPVDPSISMAVTTPGDAIAAVDQLADQGVDFIKVYTLLPRDAFLAAGRRAGERGLPVVGHLPATATVDDAISIQMADIEHMQAEIGGYCPKVDRQACEPVFSRLIAAGVAQSPTLLPRYRRAYAATHPGWGRDPELARLPPSVVNYWQDDLADKLAAPAELVARRMSDYDHEVWMAGRLIRKRAPLLAGSDTGTPFAWPGLSLHEELALLVKAGLAPGEAIAIATGGAARFMGAGGHSGRIAPGYDADLVLVEGDPSRDIADLRRIVAVVRGGVFLDRATLARMLASGASTPATKW